MAYLFFNIVKITVIFPILYQSIVLNDNIVKD